MRLISRHILSSLAAPFFWGVLALTGLLLLNQLPTLINNFGGRGLEWSVMAEAVVLALPALLTLTLPMSVLVATLYAYSTLAADLEMVAMYANGISVWRMVRPALVAAVCITIVNFLLFDQIVPISNARFKSLTQDVYRKTPTLTLRPAQLNELPATGYVLRAMEIAPTGGRLGDVTIWDLRRYDGRRVIHADSGTMAQSPDGTDLLMTLYHGEVLDFSALEPTRVERTAFRVNQVTIPDVQRQFERSSAEAERGDREKSGCELLDGIKENRWTLNDASRQRALLTRRDLRHLAGLPPLPPPAVQTRPRYAPSCGEWRGVQRFLERVLLPSRLEAQDRPPAPRQAPAARQDSQAPQDTVPLRRLPRLRVPLQRDSGAGQDVTRQDTTPPDSLQQPFGGDSAESMPLGIADTLPPSPFLVDPAQGPSRSDGLVTSMVEVSSARLQADQALRTVREYDVEYHKKFAIPLASLCFVLIGIAMALKFPRSGIGLVIGGSLLIFLALYMMLIGGESLADRGVISAEVAMYSPVVVFTVAGLAAVASANREMGTARTAGVFEWLRQSAARFRRRNAP
jgi:lipopolysaccharide export system permease protein